MTTYDPKTRTRQLRHAVELPPEGLFRGRHEGAELEVRRGVGGGGDEELVVEPREERPLHLVRLLEAERRLGRWEVVRGARGGGAHDGGPDLFFGKGAMNVG